MTSDPFPYDLALVIGRFQPFHKGHQGLFDHAHELAPQVVAVLGSYRSAPSLKNPWSYDERVSMIQSALAYTVNFVALEDSPYNPSLWYAELEARIEKLFGTKKRIVIVGHDKDASSQYLHAIPSWDKKLLSSLAEGISATELRDLVFAKNWSELQRHCPQGTLDFLRAWTKTQTAMYLQDEKDFVDAYKKSWESAPYAPVFVTADAVVLHQGHVLMIKRRGYPGKGQWALPGGFLEPHESLESASIRELLEETGIDLKQYSSQGRPTAHHVFDEPGRDPRGRLITHAFLFILSQESPRPAMCPGDDAMEAEWISLARIDLLREHMFSDHWKIIRFFANRLP